MTIPGLAEWILSAQGRYVIDWEMGRVDRIVTDLFGFNALQLGLADCDYLRANRIPFRARCNGGGAAQVVADSVQLPFASQCFDLVVLPHVLEFSPDPHQVLREVERVLMPEGHLVITGFNPLSLWGLRQRRARRTGAFPWNGDYLSVGRLKDWCKLLGLEPQGGCFGCYVPAVRDEKWLRRLQFMEAAGDRWWGIGGGVYVLQAVKRVKGMRIITPPAWRARLAARPRLAPVVWQQNRQGPAQR